MFLLLLFCRRRRLRRRRRHRRRRYWTKWTSMLFYRPYTCTLHIGKETYWDSRRRIHHRRRDSRCVCRTSTRAGCRPCCWRTGTRRPRMAAAPSPLQIHVTMGEGNYSVCCLQHCIPINGPKMFYFYVCSKISIVINISHVLHEWLNINAYRSVIRLVFVRF